MQRWIMISLALCGFAMDTSLAEGPKIYYVVRHAEKAANEGNPPLTAAGEERAKQLASLLKTLRVSEAFCSSNELRAQQTAQALDETPTAIPSMALLLAKLRSLEGGTSTLVVSHSGDVEKIVNGLSGVMVPAIGENYDNLFIVVVNGDSKQVTHLKYGQAAP